VFSTISSTQIAPHIPERPTEADVKLLLEQMDYGISYYTQGEMVPLPPHMPPGGESFKMEPVMGVYWRAGRDPNVTTLYIDGKPFAISSTWVFTTIDRQNKYAKMAKKR